MSIFILFYFILLIFINNNIVYAIINFKINYYIIIKYWLLVNY